MSGVELLVGAAASGTAGTAGFTAATGGLFGAGGAVTAGASLSTLASVAGAIGALSQGAAASNAANFNAQVANNNALAARAAAAENADRQRRLSVKRKGANRANDPDKLDLLEDSAIEEELAISDIISGGTGRSIGFASTAALDRARGSAARTGGATSAFGSLLGVSGNFV